jgi:DNA polymerase I
MSLDDVKLHLIEDLEDCGNFLTWLSSRDAESIAVDTETTGLVQGTDFVRLVQVGGATHGWAIPWEQWNGVFHDVVRRYRGRYILHNALFDHGMLAHSKCDLPTDRIDDTWVGANVLESHVSAALKPQAARHVDELAAGAQAQLDLAIKSGGWTWATVPITFAPYWQYAALDTVLTRHLWDYQQPLIEAIAPKSYDLELSVLWVIAKMMKYGAFIDRPYAIEKKQVFDDFVETAGIWVKSEYGVSAGSNQAIVRILQDLGFEFTKATEAGATSLDKEVLGGIDHPLARTILQRRQLQKLSSTYLKHFIEESDSASCIHPSINPLGARTGRMSIKEPGLQTLPRKSEANKAAETVRNCIATRYDGGSLLMCDFGQIEMRVLAHMSGDHNLQAAFLGEEDFFVNLARALFNDPHLVKADPRRQITKNVGYAKIYGAGIPKLALTAGITEDQARLVMSRWDSIYPGVRQFQTDVDRRAWTRQRTDGAPYAISPLTGKRLFADTNKVYALVNYLIQGVGAELLKMKILELDAAGLGDYMVVPVHDEIVLDVPEDMIDDAATTLRDTMNDSELLSVPITAEVSAGQRWGAKTEYKIE